MRSDAIIFIRSQIVNAWFRERSGWVRGTKANKKKDSAARCRFSSFARTHTRYLFVIEVVSENTAVQRDDECVKCE